MNIKVITKLKFSRIILFPILLSVLFSMTSFAQPSQLSLVDIFTALKSDKATLEQKNELLVEGVKQRGVTFVLSLSLQGELKKAGASDTLIETIRLINPAPVEKPKVEPTPKPAPTPKPKDFAFYRNEGNSNYVLGNYDSAIKQYNEAIKLNDKDSKVFFSRGLAYLNEKQLSLAVADFTKVSELDPEESMAFYNRATALKEMGKFEEALEDYKKASELDPENATAKNAFEKLKADLMVTTSSNTVATKVNDAESPDETETTVEKTKAPINIGTLQELAIKLASPSYPSTERAFGVEGVVTVKVIIDEEGKVISAEAISGPKGLRSPSEVAAKRSKFKPYLLDNAPVKATGYINYNFKK